MVIQARPKTAAPAPAAPRPAAEPVARPAPAERPRPAPAPAGDPLAFDDDEDAPASRRRPRRRGNGLVLGLAVTGTVLAVGVVAAVLAQPYIAQLLARGGAVAQNDDTGRAAGKSDLPARHDTGRKTEHPARHETGGKPDLPTDTGPFPRRALAVSINNYLFANPINFGMPGPASRNVRALVEQRFSHRDGLRIPANQMAVLSDALPGSSARPPTDSVIRGTIVNFLNTSRAQDRVLLLIIGHVVEVGGEPSLLPIDGEVGAKEGGIPLKWIYDQLAACKARQKVLILDTCRLDPAKGQERPGSGPMGEKLDAMLKEPPPGVQVWSACVGGEYSYEMIDNGVFLDALYDTLAHVSDGKIQSPADTFPLERLVEAVNGRMQQTLGPLGKVQTSRLTGSEAEGGAEPDPKEPAPPAPKVMGSPSGSADPLVRSILQDISFPPLKVAQDQRSLSPEALPPLPAEALKEYMKDGPATPLRDEVKRARDLLNNIAGQHMLKDYYMAIAEDALKKQVKKDQMAVAKVIGELMEASDALKAVAEHRKDETKRWQATYDYVVARVEAQLAYLNEYQAVLGQILKGMAPPDPKLYSGWRLASQTDPQTGDGAAKKLSVDSRKKLDKIIKDYPGTPWALMARRDKVSALGLEWQPMKR
jgi:hypothetical protein